MSSSSSSASSSSSSSSSSSGGIGLGSGSSVGMSGRVSRKTSFGDVNEFIVRRSLLTSGSGTAEETVCWSVSGVGWGRDLSWEFFLPADPLL